MTIDFKTQSLGTPALDSPYFIGRHLPENHHYFVQDSHRVVYGIDQLEAGFQVTDDMLMELAGPRQKIFFNPANVRAGIVTCGGLCPGLNNVIRSIVMCLWYIYGVRTIFGVQNGLKGFLKEYNRPPVQLTPADVANIHYTGGTMLGSSRGGRDRIQDIVNSIIHMKLDMLFVIGGDGTQRAAKVISEELASRNLKIAVIGIPKTIDNDLAFVEKSFGYETAVEKAVESIRSAHIEATNAINGIGLVKVMGRESGFIAVSAALAENDVNFVLIPETPFDLDGPGGLLAHLEARLAHRSHAVLLVAEGAGQDLIPPTNETDESGNRKLGDIGKFLMKQIAGHFAARNIEINTKYIDPSYIIRSAPANPNDSIYCYRLGNLAVHAAMAGKTNLLVSRINNRFVHIPIALATSRRNIVDIHGPMWRDVIECTGQPYLMTNVEVLK